jgi:alginate O-acetyltransferase complex protein AlgI
MPDFLKNIFLFNENSPLIFTRLNFWVFFIIVILGYSVIFHKNKLRNLYLFLVSMFFYYKTGGLFLATLIFSIVANYYITLALFKTKSDLIKKFWIALSVTVNIGLLSFFKYDYFFTETINSLFHTHFEVVTHAAKWSNALFGTHFDLGAILPPVGISFFTFHSLSYIIDAYRNKVSPVKNLVDYGFYVSFFPQLVAGPIVRASQFVPQMYKDYHLSDFEFGYGFYLILKGLVKKMLIGDFIAVNLIDRVFSNPSSYSGFENLVSLYGYSLQVYCDFSGYTDIAIGIALLMGFYLPKNFNSPYKAKNVGDFWKRWHMSLSSWLKDYLYIPLGGNRGGTFFTYFSLFVIFVFIVLISGKLILIPAFLIAIGIVWIISRIFPSIRITISTNINLMITMLLGGLWHGSSWMFIIWGGLNGLGLIIYKSWRKISPYENSNFWIANFWKIFITFNFITFTRIWFRGESMQGTSELISQVAHKFGWALVPEIAQSYWKVLAIMAVGFIVHWLPEKVKIIYRDWFIARPIYQKIIISVVVVFTIYQSVSAGLQPFIYFRF